VGWVLTHLEEVRSRLQCRDPPIAVLPVGTGNDLARVLGFGSGWGGEDVKTLLAQVKSSGGPLNGFSPNLYEKAKRRVG